MNVIFEALSSAGKLKIESTWDLQIILFAMFSNLNWCKDSSHSINNVCLRITCIISCLIQNYKIKELEKCTISMSCHAALIYKVMKHVLLTVHSDQKQSINVSCSYLVSDVEVQLPWKSVKSVWCRPNFLATYKICMTKHFKGKKK